MDAVGTALKAFADELSLSEALDQSLVDFLHTVLDERLSDWREDPSSVDEDEVCATLGDLLAGYVPSFAESGPEGLARVRHLWREVQQLAPAAPGADAAAPAPAIAAPLSLPTEVAKENSCALGDPAGDPGEAGPGEGASAELVTLCDLWPHLSPRWLASVLARCAGDASAAAEAVLDALDTGAAVARVSPAPRARGQANAGAASARIDAELRERIVQQYGLRPAVKISGDPRELRKLDRARSLAPVLVPEDKASRVRYRDGHIVATNGERFIIEKEEVPEHMRKTFVALKVKRKGARGPGLK